MISIVKCHIVKGRKTKGEILLVRSVVPPAWLPLVSLKGQNSRPYSGKCSFAQNDYIKKLKIYINKL